MQPPMQMSPVHSREQAEIDAVVDRAITSGDPLIATEYGNQLRRTIISKGIGLAHLLYGLKSNWVLFRAAGIEEEFGDFINAHMQIASRTADKYADMYEVVFVNAQLPDDLKLQLAKKPMKELLLLTAAVREGSLDRDDLEDVAVLDYSGVRDRVRAARGDATSSYIVVYGRLVQREQAKYPPGTIVAYGNGEEEAIGYLKLDASTDAGRKMVERIKNANRLEDIR